MHYLIKCLTLNNKMHNSSMCDVIFKTYLQHVFILDSSSLIDYVLPDDDS